MYRDHEFDPVTPEEQARREQEEEFARRVRREVRRMERGEAEEDIRADEEREAEVFRSNIHYIPHVCLHDIHLYTI